MCCFDPPKCNHLLSDINYLHHGRAFISALSFIQHFASLYSFIQHLPSKLIPSSSENQRRLLCSRIFSIFWALQYIHIHIHIHNHSHDGRASIGLQIAQPVPGLPPATATTGRCHRDGPFPRCRAASDRCAFNVADTHSPQSTQRPAASDRKVLLHTGL